jgi:hypothetical protein
VQPSTDLNKVSSRKEHSSPKRGRIERNAQATLANERFDVCVYTRVSTTVPPITDPFSAKKLFSKLN